MFLDYASLFLNKPAPCEPYRLLTSCVSLVIHFYNKAIPLFSVRPEHAPRSTAPFPKPLDQNPFVNNDAWRKHPMLNGTWQRR
jgi:hypothetical protein